MDFFIDFRVTERLYGSGAGSNKISPPPSYTASVIHKSVLLLFVNH